MYLGAGAIAWACAAPPPPVRAPEPVTVPAPTASIAEAAPRQPPVLHDRLPTDVPELRAVSCTVTTGDDGLFEQLPLRVTASAEPYATIRSAPAELALAERADAGARLSAEADGYAVRGLLRHDDFVLHSAAARAAGVIVPEPHAPLSWLGSDSGQVRLGLAPKGGIALSPGQKLEWSWPCDALTLAHQEFEPRTATGLGESSDIEYLDGKAPVWIRSEPNGGVQVQIQSTAGDLRVEVHERNSASVRILREDRYAVWFGWVDASRVAKKPSATSRLGGSHRTRPPRVRFGGQQLLCDQDVPLHVLMPDRASVIGAVRAHTRLTVGDEAEDPRFDGHYRQLRNPPYWLALASGVTLVARASDLDVCYPPGSGGPMR